jgi:hypothetical protein
MKNLLCGADTLVRESGETCWSIPSIVSEEKANQEISLEKFPKGNPMSTKVGTTKNDKKALNRRER